MPQEKIFADGIFFQKRDGAPSFIVGSLSLKVAELIPFLQKHELNSGYVNIDIKQSQKGGYYCELNTWKPTKEPVKEETKNQSELNNMDTIEYPEEEINPDDIPF